MNKKTKQTYSIRGKLISAACMLLVAVIMVVSSTYAWFTLSTAPEVTGIQTAIGANGALEMALYTGTVNDGVLPSTATQADKNTYWGNLVDLSNGYGLEEITLYPSVLNLNGTTIPASPLLTPGYGADGRVSELLANAQTGTWDSTEKAFFPGNDLGVRGVGSVSGMTPRQLSYRNARSEASTAAALAKTLAAQSLNTNGSALANIAITHGIGDDAGKYTAANVATLRAIIDSLNGEGGILDQIETAYIQYILAYAASAASGDADTAWQAVSGEVSKADATLTSITTALTNNGVTLPDALTNAITAYNATVADVATAETALATLEAKVDANEAATFNWSEISTPLTPLADTSAMTINGYKASEVKTNLGDLVSSVTTNGGLVVTMATGGGVYADIADQCGDYTASVTIDKVEYSGITLNNMNAKMETKSTQTPSYLSAIGTAVGEADAPKSSTDVKMPMSEFYGYILDLAFRTNAAESNLLLQTAPKDRIYEDNTNEDTAGSGSTMTFMSIDTNFSNDQVKALMENLRVVFFTPLEGDADGNVGTVLAYAKLDMSKSQIVVDEEGNTAVEAPLYLYENVFKTDADGNYVDANNNVLYYKVGDAFYAPADCTVAEDGTVTANEDATPVEEENMTGLVETTTFLAEEDAVITAMTQNATVKVSAMVYLDGNTIGNDDVSATATKSMTGKMNLQFSSSANLVPMEYKDLHITDSTADSGTTDNGGEGN